MVSKQIFSLTILILLMLCLLLEPIAAVNEQTSSVTVSLPITGSLALPVGIRPNEKLYVINTSTGDIKTVVSNPGPNNNPIWNSQGNRLAYYNIRNDGIINDLTAEIPNVIEPFTQFDAETLFFPVGWSLDDTNILFLKVQVQLPSSVYTLQQFELASGSFTEVLRLSADAPLTKIPITSGHSDLKIIGIPQVKRNPVYDNWVMLQLETQEIVPKLTLDGGIPFYFVNILWNYSTGQMISLDNLFTDPIRSSDFDWSPDGRYLLATTSDPRQNDTTHLLQFQNDGSVQVVDNAPTSRTSEFWLGAGNLVIARSLDTTTDEFVYYIGEIFGGKWHETEFLRLHGDEFRAMRPGDWYIRASEQEKQKLSCTFDQTLPTQLQIDSHAKVTSGASSRLRAEPTTYSAEVGTLPAGTTFDVIGGMWCANGYRWWNIQLADGRSGWAAEADPRTYFLEPA